jgi:hypothetical protein
MVSSGAKRPARMFKLFHARSLSHSHAALKKNTCFLYDSAPVSECTPLATDPDLNTHLSDLYQKLTPKIRLAYKPAELPK